MPTWAIWGIIFLINLSLSALSYALMPSQKINDAEKEDITSDDINKAEEGQFFCKVWGRRCVGDANIVAFGNVSTTPIKSSTGSKK